MLNTASLSVFWKYYVCESESDVLSEGVFYTASLSVFWKYYVCESERDVLTGGGIAALEEEEVVYYLKKNFSQYGLEFFEGTPARAAVGNYDALVIKAANGKEFKTALDKTLIAESRRDSAAIVDFITENAVLPEDQLTPEQKEFREQLKVLKESFEQNRLEQEKCMNLLKEVLHHIGNINLLKSLIH